MQENKVISGENAMHNAKVWQKVLSADEKVEYEFTVGNRYRTTGLIIWSIISIPFLITFATFSAFVISSEPPGFLLIGLFYLLPLIGVFNYGFYMKAANAYAFTNKRILIHKGWLSTKMISVDYNKIADVRVREPFIGKILFSIGTIEIVTVGTSSIEIVLKHIQKPYELKKRLDLLKDK